MIPAAAAPVPEVKVETWTPKRPKTGKYSKLNTVKNALNKLIYAGQKRSFSAANNGANQGNVFHEILSYGQSTSLCNSYHVSFISQKGTLISMNNEFLDCISNYDRLSSLVSGSEP